MHVSFTLICLLLCEFSTAQQYAFVNYSTKDGLINNRIHAIHQDNFGKLYFATSEGLSVYDGSRFTNYNTDNGLATSLVNDIIEINDDSVLIIPNDRKLQCIVHGEIKNVKTVGDFSPVINQLIKSGADTYYGLGDEGLFLFNKNKFTEIKLPVHLPVSNENKNLYHGTLLDQNLFINTNIRSPVYPGPSSFFVYNINNGNIIRNDDLPAVTYSVETPQNEVLVSTLKGIFRINKSALINGRIELLPLSSMYSIPQGIVASYMYFDRQENLWITTLKGIIKVEPNKGYKLFTQLNGLSENEYTSIFQDRENIMWFGNEQTGVTKLAYQNLELYAQIKPGFIVSNITVDEHSDSIWLYNVNNNQFLLQNTNTLQSSSANEKTPFTTIVIKNKVAYVARNASLYKLLFSHNNLFSFELLFTDFSNNSNFSSLLIDEVGNLIAIKNKIIVILKNHKILELPIEYFADQAVLTKDDLLWVITRTKKLYEYKIHPFEPDRYIELIHIYDKELAEMDPRSLAIDNKGNIWIGTRNYGLYCYSFDHSELHLKKQLKVNDGLTENFIQNLFCDAENNIWVCSRGGLDKITFTKNHFNIENITRSCNWNLNVLKIQEDRHGIIWGLANSGILKLHPEKNLSTDYTPKIFFESVTAGARTLSLLQKGINVRYDENDLKFHVAAPSFIDERETRFSYRLEGSQKNSWSEPSDQADINFVGLSPGSYSFKVRAVFLNGRYAPQESEYSFVITPPWWETWWFRSAEFLGIILVIVYFVQSYYRSKLRRQQISMEKQQAIEKERTRIATDMHDDLGSGLTKIAILSEVAKRQIGDTAKALKELDKISDSSRELANNLQDIIWVLNPGNDSLESLSAYIREYTLKFFDGTTVVAEFDYPVQLPHIILSEEIRRTIFLVVKETLNNTAKYAASQTILIKLFIVGNGFQIIIEDQGKGFDLSKVREFANGLANMKSRMVRINGSYEIYSSINEGTKTILNVPF